VREPKRPLRAAFFASGAISKNPLILRARNRNLISNILIPLLQKIASKAVAIGYHSGLSDFFEIRFFRKNTIRVIVLVRPSLLRGPGPMALRFETARSARPPAPPNRPAGGGLPRHSSTRPPQIREAARVAFSMRPVTRNPPSKTRSGFAALPAERIRSQMAPQKP